MNRFSNIGPSIVSFFSRVPIAWRITGWYTIFLVLMLFLIATVIMQFIKIWEDTEIRSDLEHYMVNLSEHPSQFKSLHNGIYTFIYTHEGSIIKGPVPDHFPLEAPYSYNKLQVISVENMTFYYYDIPFKERKDGKSTGTIRGVIPLSTVHRKTNSLVIGLLAGGITFIIIATFGGYWVIRRGLRPLRRMTETADEIGKSQDLSKRIQPVDGNDEIHYLGHTFNDMLDSLEQSAQRERQFSSDVSHELRTPIAVIQAESDYGRHYVASIEEAKESFTHIFKQSRTMSSMITQLLELARLDKMTEIKKEPFNVSTLLEEIMNEYKVICRATGTKMTISIEPHITIVGNRILIGRAIGNLVDNALKYCEGTVSIALDTTNTYARIAVSDNGPGIDSTDWDKIWNRFYQAESSRNKSNNTGLGLGLAFVKNVVRGHQGQTNLTSRPHEETTFTILLPLQGFETEGHP